MSTREDRRRVGLCADRKVAPLLKIVEGKSTVNGLSTSRPGSSKTRIKDEDEPPKSTNKTRQSNALRPKADGNTKARKGKGKEGGKKRASSPPIEDPTRPPESSSDSSDNEADIPADIPSQYERLPRATHIGNSQPTKTKHTRSSQPDPPTQPYTGSAFRGAARPRRTPSYGTKKEIPETQSQSSEIESQSQSGLMSHMNYELGVPSQNGSRKGKATYGGSSQSRKVSSSAPEKRQVKNEKEEGKKEFKVFSLLKDGRQEKEETPKKTFKTYGTVASSQESAEEGKKTFRKFRGVFGDKESPIEKKKTFKSYGLSESLGSSGSEKRAFRTVDGILKDEGVDDSDSDADLNIKYPAKDADTDTSSDDSSRPSPRKKRLVDGSASPKKKSRTFSNSDDSDPDDTKTLCPMCGSSVPLALLLAFTPNRPPSLSTRQQAAFCTHHRRASALTTSSALGYPQINWPQLPRRIASHFPYLARLLAAPDSTPSHYRGLLAADIAAGRNRTLKQSIMGEEDKVLVPGYYGARGARVMQERILERFGAELRREAVRDEVVSARGVGGYVAGVLVLEVGVRLVGEDLGFEVDKEGDGEWMEQARRRMEESAAWGTLVNVEVEEG